MDKSYHKQNGCHNCTHVFRMGEHDAGTTYYCTEGAPTRPLCGSVLMNENFSGAPYNDKEFEKNMDLWDEWSEKRDVWESGTCKHWKEIQIIPGVYINQLPHPTPTFDWLDDDYVPCQQLFPEWVDAEKELSIFVKRMGDWKIVTNKDSIKIGLNAPKVIIDDKEVLILDTLPPIIRDVVDRISLCVMEDYTPDLDTYLGEALDPIFQDRLRADIKVLEQEIINHGGRNVKDELAFRLGLRDNALSRCVR